MHGYFADAHRTGDLSYISNQSLNGLFIRLMGGPSQARLLWAASAAGTAIFVLWLGAGRTREGHGWAKRWRCRGCFSYLR